MKKLTYLFLFLTLYGCQKPIVFPEGAGPGRTAPAKEPGSTSNAIYYFRGNLDGVAANWEVEEDFSISKYADGTSSRGYRDLGVSWGYFGGAITKTGDSFPQYYPQIHFEFGTIKVNFDDNFFSYLKSFLKVGKWDYSSSFEPIIGNKGMIISYTDKSNKEYYTIGTQTSNVEVVSTVELPATLGRLDGLNVKLTFACKLYPKDGVGNPITVTNGEAFIRVESDLY